MVLQARGSWFFQLNQYFLEMTFQDIAASRLMDGTHPKEAAESHQPEQIQARLRGVNRSESATFEPRLQTQRGRAAESEQA